MSAQFLATTVAVTVMLAGSLGAAEAQGQGSKPAGVPPNWSGTNPPGFGVEVDRRGWGTGTQPPGWNNATGNSGWGTSTVPPGLGGTAGGGGGGKGAKK
jgi:hypothetical protein